MIEAARNEFDYGTIRIAPNIQDRINEMHRHRAEKKAAEMARIAVESQRKKALAQIEAARYRSANTELLIMLHAALGWPKRVLLPVPDGGDGMEKHDRAH